MLAPLPPALLPTERIHEQWCAGSGMPDQIPAVLPAFTRPPLPLRSPRTCGLRICWAEWSNLREPGRCSRPQRAAATRAANTTSDVTPAATATGPPRNQRERPGRWPSAGRAATAGTWRRRGGASVRRLVLLDDRPGDPAALADGQSVVTRPLPDLGDPLL